MRDYFRNRQVLGSIRQLDVVVPEFFPKDGLVSYYKLDGNSNDVTGNHNGVDTQITYGLGYGKVGQGALFTTSPSYSKIVTSGNIGIYGNAARTVAFWVKSLQSSNYYFYWGIESYNQNFGFTTEGGTQYKLYIYNNDWNTGVAPSSNLDFIALTHDGTTLKLYVNNSLVASVAKTLNTANTPLVIGQQASVSTGSFSGWFDEFGVWSRALTSDEISQLYNSGTGLAYN